MATEVVHGKRPKFKATLQPGSYRMILEGHYTTTPGLAAAGVTEMRWNSKRPRKRRAELLTLRSAFVGFFLEEWIKQGGTWRDGVAALRRYPFDRVRAKLRRHRSAKVRAAAAAWSPFDLVASVLWQIADRK